LAKLRQAEAKKNEKVLKKELNEVDDIF